MDRPEDGASPYDFLQGVYRGDSGEKNPADKLAVGAILAWSIYNLRKNK